MASSPGSLGFPIDIHKSYMKAKMAQMVILKTVVHNLWNSSYEVFTHIQVTFRHLNEEWGCFFQGSSFKSNRNILARSLNAIIHLLLIQVQTFHYGWNKISHLIFAWDLVIYYSFYIRSCNQSFPTFSLCYRTLCSEFHNDENAQAGGITGLVVTYCRTRQPWHASFPSLSWHTNNTSLTGSSCWTRGAIRALKSTKDKTTLLSFQWQ